MGPTAEETKTPSGAIGAVISDLENEYERSKKFLADLYLSLEAGGVKTRQGASDPSEDSPFIRKESDGPPSALLQDTAAINPFVAVGLTRQDSELSNCSSDYSTSIPHLPNLNPDANRITSANHSQSGVFANSSSQVQRRPDAQRIPSAFSPLRSRASGRASRKQPAVYSSCPCIDPAQDEGYECAAAAAASHSGSNVLDSIAPLQPRISVGPVSFEASSPTFPHMLVPPSPPVGSHRNRRSSLDFVPAPPAHHRKWLDGSHPGGQLASPPVAGNNAAQAGRQYHPLVKRGSLEIFGCTAAAALGCGGGGGGGSSCSGGHVSCSGAAPGGPHGTSAGGGIAVGAIAAGGIPGSGSIAGGAITGGGGNSHPSILSRASCSTTRRLPLTAFSPPHAPQGPVHPHAQWHPPSPSPSPSPSPLQSQQLTYHPLSHQLSLLSQYEQPQQLQPQSLSLPLQMLQLNSPGATASGGSPPLGVLRLARSRRVTESGQGPPSVGSPGQLPQLLQPAQSNVLPLSLTSPGARGAEQGGGGGGGGGSPGSSPLADVMRLGSLNGIQPSGGGPLDSTSSPGDVRPRSARFSRCGLAAAPAAATIATSSAAATFPTALPATPAAAAAATALLSHSLSSSDRRPLSSGEVPERLTPRTALTACISGPGSDGVDGRSCGGSPFSARGIRPDIASTLTPRRRISLPGEGGASAFAAGAAAAAPEPLSDQHVPNGALAAAATFAAASAAAAAASPLDLPRQSGPPAVYQHHSLHNQPSQYQHQGHPHPQPHQQHLFVQPHSQPPAAIRPPGGIRGEAQTRLRSSGRSAA